MERRLGLIGGISCQYCGGSHALVSEVKACWERSRRVVPPGPSTVSRQIGTEHPAAALGRSVVVRPGQAPPEEWAACHRWDGDLDHLETAWRQRVPLVIEVTDERADAEVEGRPVWLSRRRLRFVVSVWASSCFPIRSTSARAGSDGRGATQLCASGLS